VLATLLKLTNLYFHPKKEGDSVGLDTIFLQLNKGGECSEAIRTQQASVKPDGLADR